MKRHCIAALLLLVLLPPGLANGQLQFSGIAITKQGQYDKDIHAAAVPFTGMQTSGPLTSFGLAAGGRLNVPNGQIVQIVNFGDAQTRNLSTPADAEFLKALSDSLAKVARQYPKSQPHLQQVQAVIAADLRRFFAGEVRINNQWMSAEHAASLAKQQAEREMAQRMAEQERLAAEHARVAAAQQDLERKRSNLKNRWKSSGASFLASVVETSLTDPDGTPPSRKGSLASFPPVDRYFEPKGVDLPDFLGCNVVLYDGADSMSMGCLTMSSGGDLKRILAVLPMAVKDGKCQNAEQAKVFYDFVTRIDTDLGRWLPVGLASARTKLLKFGSSATEDGVSVAAEVQDKICGLTLTRPEVANGGTDYYYVAVFIE